MQNLHVFDMALPLVSKETELRKAENTLRAINHPLRKKNITIAGWQAPD